MILNLKNICAISDCKINIEKTNIIAGENSTGKSTIGKVLFVLIKSLNIDTIQENFKKKQLYDMSNLITKIYSQIQFYNSDEIKKRGRYVSRRYIEDISREILNNYTSPLTKEDFLDIIDKVIYIFFKANSQNHDISLNQINIYRKISKQRNYEKILYDYMDKINMIISEDLNIHNELKFNFLKYLNSVFPDGIQNMDAKENSSEISLYNNGDVVFLIKFDAEGNLQEFYYLDKFLFENSFFLDVTIIQSPSLLQVQNLISSAHTKLPLYDSPNFIKYDNIVDEYIKDLNDKLTSLNLGSVFSKLDEEKTNIDFNIESIIGGKVWFNEIDEKFIFTDKKNNRFSIENVASGIKSFGIIQILLEKNLMKKNKLLIIDEPENGLHPEWQVQYAKLICELTEKNIPLLITTHSPFMVQAINYFCKDKVDFYLIEKESDFNVVKNATNYIDVILNKLTYIFDDIM